MTVGHIFCTATEGVVRPVLHQLLPLGKEVTAPIRSLHLRIGQAVIGFAALSAPELASRDES